MKTRAKLAGVAALTVALGVGVFAFTAHSQGRHPGHGPFGRQGMTPEMGMGMMGMAHLVNHDRITRTVTNLPNGIRTVTESNDPALAAQIKKHVAEMGGRVGAGNDPNLPIESEALHAIFRGKDKITTSYETTDKGVAVVQTSDDADTVAALQTHAAEVSDLVRGGMAALHTAMMKNHGGAMGGPMMMMRGGMMHRDGI